MNLLLLSLLLLAIAAAAATKPLLMPVQFEVAGSGTFDTCSFIYVSPKS